MSMHNSNASPNDSAAAPPRASGHRDNARSLLQRLHATPVKLLPLKLNALLPSQGPSVVAQSAVPSRDSFGPVATERQRLLNDTRGLGTHDVLIAQYDAAAAATISSNGRGGVTPTLATTSTAGDGIAVLHHWQLHMAALHTMRGGRVALVYAPGTQTFRLDAFVNQLEALVRSNPAMPYEDGDVSVEDAVAGQQARVLSALGRLTVVSCEDAEDLSVFCRSFSFSKPTPTRASSTLVVPLVMCFGFAGQGSYLFHYERAAGREVPLRHWLLCELRQRVPCALVIVEWPHGAASFTSGWKRDRDGTTNNTPTRTTPASHAAHSDVVSRLAAPHRHRHANDDDNNSNNNARSATTPIAELTDSQFYCLTLSPASATLQKVRLSDGTNAHTTAAPSARNLPSHLELTRPEASPVSGLSDARHTRPRAETNSGRAGQCAVEEQTSIAFTFSEFADLL